MQLQSQSLGNFAAVGGLPELCRALTTLIAKALTPQGAHTYSSPNAKISPNPTASPVPNVTTIDVPLLEMATRGIAQIALSAEGRAALKGAGGVIRSLVSIVRADSEALSRVVKQLGKTGGLGEVTRQEGVALISPLRFVTGLPIALSASQQVRWDLGFVLTIMWMARLIHVCKSAWS